MTKMGFKYGEERRKKISKTMLEKWKDDEYRNNMSLSRKGRKSPMQGKYHTEESKNKISESLKGEKNPFYGKKHSIESLKKMGLIHKGQIPYNKLNFTEKQIWEIIRLYNEELLSAENIGKKFNISSPTVRKVLNKNNINTSRIYRKKLIFLGKTYEELYGKEKAEELKDKISLSHKGEKCYLWKGGKSFEPYDVFFNNKFKRAIRKRDNQICMLCGIHKERLNRALDIHHINYNKLLTISENCISLCNSCHTKTNENREHWTKFFQSLLAEKYNYKYSSENEIVLEVKNGI